MYINLESDYAVRIVTYLCRTEGRLDAAQIAEKTDVPQRFALKILRKLVAGGILKSYKGVKGGYIIHKKPEEITLLEIIEIIEGRYSISRCLLEKECRHNHWCIEQNCKVQQVYSNVSDLVRNELNQVTFNRLMGDVKNS